MMTLLTFNFAKRLIRLPNVYLEVSNMNHFGSVSDILGRLPAASECMASPTWLNTYLAPVKYGNIFIIWMSRKCDFILYTFNYYVNMVYLYYLKFKVVSPIVRMH